MESKHVAVLEQLCALPSSKNKATTPSQPKLRAYPHGPQGYVWYGIIVYETVARIDSCTLFYSGVCAVCEWCIDARDTTIRHMTAVATVRVVGRVSDAHCVIKFRPMLICEAGAAKQATSTVLHPTISLVWGSSCVG